MIACAALALFLCAGLFLVRRQLPWAALPERLWLGLALGMLLFMWLPNLFAHALGFTRRAHLAAALALLPLSLTAHALRDPRAPRAMGAADRRLLRVLLAFLLPMTAFSAYLQFTHMLQPLPDGALGCGQSTYGDLCMHLAFTTALPGMDFPPRYTLLSGTALSYPYLVDALSASLVLLGLPLSLSLVLPGTLLMALCYAGFFLLGRRVLGDHPRTLLFAALLFFFNGGLGFLYDFDLAYRDGFARVIDIFTGYYHTPANQPELNLRFSNVIADLMIPQRALLAGWAMGMPAFWLLLEMRRRRAWRLALLLGLWAGALPLVHTHTFLALGLFSAGFLAAALIVCLRCGRGARQMLALSAAYLSLVLLLALPQLLGHAIRQTLEGGALRLQFNWVNNSGNRGLIDGYLWFWIKNAGLPFALFLVALPDLVRRGHGEVLCGMGAIFLVAECILFQPNEYDNNKLFTIWYLFLCLLCCDYGAVIYLRLAGLRGRVILAGAFLLLSILSGALSLGREAISHYQLFSQNAVDAGAWIEENTPRDAVFITGQQHINPVVSLAGRQIVCGSDLYVFFHGLNYREQAEDCRRFYEDPEQNADVLSKYGVSHIYLSDYERSELAVDARAIEARYPLLYENADVKVYCVPSTQGENADPAGEGTEPEGE